MNMSLHNTENTQERENSLPNCVQEPSSSQTQIFTTQQSPQPPCGSTSMWLEKRQEWLTPNEIYIAKSEELKDYADKCKALIKYESQRLPIYRRLVYQRETFRSPINLQHLV